MTNLADALQFLRDNGATAYRADDGTVKVPHWNTHKGKMPSGLTEVLATYPGDLAKLTPPLAPPASADEHEEQDATSDRTAPRTVGWQPKITRLSDVQPERIAWLWRGRVALGKVGLLDGDPGDGKSTLTTDIAARISTGREMPDGTPGLGYAAGVVLLSAEDGLADTIRPRLDAAGSDPDRVVALECAVDGDRERGVTLADLPFIEAAIVGVDARFVVVDPLMAYLGSDTDSYRDQDVRGILAPLARLAERRGVAILVVRHFSKGITTKVIHKGGGSVGIVGAVRTAMMVARDPDEPDGPRRILAQTKSNVAAFPPSLAFHMEESANGAARIVWEGVSTHTAAALNALPAEPEERAVRNELQHALRAALANGPRPAEEAKREVKGATGATDKQIRTARERLGVVVSREGFDGGVWRWRLPVAVDAHATPVDAVDAHTQEVGSIGIYGDARASMGVGEGGDANDLRMLAGWCGQYHAAPDDYPPTPYMRTVGKRCGIAPEAGEATSPYAARLAVWLTARGIDWRLA